ncbi:hypothetical protein RCOM_0508020 [Ricinus communis]|uniref:Aminotransferase-like plant mobile domain-containing protein n=1 Tax=Ricinus communis TaxID=3988 RepID=B9T0E8_RICCO|nr:hypothetical protein RCOM_0508020 [Ricinus communis]
MLQDVAILTGLPINGYALIGLTRYDWPTLCERVLGLRPTAESIRGSQLRLSWIRTKFGNIPHEADKETVHCHARAYIILGLTSYDKSTVRVSLVYLPYLENIGTIHQYS